MMPTSFLLKYGYCVINMYVSNYIWFIFFFSYILSVSYISAGRSVQYSILLKHISPVCYTIVKTQNI